MNLMHNVFGARIKNVSNLISLPVLYFDFFFLQGHKYDKCCKCSECNTESVDTQPKCDVTLRKI